MSNVIPLGPRVSAPARGRTYCPVPFFIDNEIRYAEFQAVLEAAGMQIVRDPQHPGSHVVVRSAGEPAADA